MTWQSIGAVLVRARILIALCSLAILTACGGGSDNNTTTADIAFCDSTDFQQVLNTVPKAATAATNRKTAQAVASGTVRIHYHRTDSTYTGWTTYVYGAKPTGEAMGGWPGAAATGTDDFGVYWDVPTTAAFNFIIYNATLGREPSSWASKTGTDEQQFWDIAGGNEIWKLSGDSTNYTANPQSAATPNITTVRVHYKRYDSGYDNWGLHLWDGSGLNTAALPSGLTISDWDHPVALKSMTGYAADSFGVTFDIPVLNPTDNAANPTTLQFILHGTGSNTGNKDGWSENIKVPYTALTITNKVGEIWLIQEDTTVHYSKPDSRSASTTDAKAYWLTKNLIQWPKVDGSDSTLKFKLYYSATGAIVATKDAKVSGADGSIDLTAGATVPTDAATRFKYIGAGVVLSTAAKDSDLIAAHAKQLVLVQEDASGNVQNATTAQVAGAFDELFSSAQSVSDLGATVAGGKTTIKLWAPSAQKVKVCSYDSGSGKATAIEDATKDEATGVWTLSKSSDLSGKYYTFVVDVFVRGTGLVRNRVTDPYSVSLTTDSKRSYITDLATANKPDGWDDATKNPNPTLQDQVDMSVYELHVRDFSANDSTVSDAHKGKYLAFTDTGSNGMKHLIALKNAGLTDVHLLPVFDIATVPETGCTNPTISGSTGDSTIAKTAVAAVADTDCFNWGYDPYHYTAPEGSYATDPSDGAVRIKEFRQMVMALHAQGLRVGMDVVYNHTHAAGQDAKSVLDRIVPGYYQRLSSSGTVTTDTCCSDTATENAMMAKLMTDSVKTWATQYKIDSFRFDLMGFQPRAVMENLKTVVNTATGRNVFLIGEGWNYGAVANDARFVQASQLSLNGSGIGTFSDRGRDRIRGGGYGQTPRSQGYVTGYFYDPNDVASGQTKTDLMDIADVIRVALAGSLRTYTFTDRQDNASANGTTVKYGSDPAGYVSQPQEVVNYYENHDNETMWDAIVAKMPKATSLDDRVRAQSLAAAINSLSQGVAYFHAGSDILRSKSMDSNSFNSGDWFNRLDWSYTANNYGVGTPLQGDASIAAMFLASDVYKSYQPAGTQIAAARDVFRDFLAIRNSSTLFRMRTAADIQSRLKFYNTGSTQEPTVIAAHLNGAGYAGATYSDVVYVVNVDKQAHSVVIGAEAGKSYTLHPIQAKSVDAVVKTSAYTSGTGTFTVPARTAAVFVVQAN